MSDFHAFFNIKQVVDGKLVLKPHSSLLPSVVGRFYLPLLTTNRDGYINVIRHSRDVDKRANDK